MWISVVMPVYNAAETLSEQLEAMASQDFDGEWELILADNGSTDDTLEIAESFRGTIPVLRVVDASQRRGASQARNIGAAAARGEHLVFCDSDDRVAHDWLSRLSDALRSHDFVAGSVDHATLNSGPPSSHWRSHVTSLPLALRFKPFAMSCNMAVRRSAFERAGGFPEDLPYGGEDVALSWQLQLDGLDLHLQPDAMVAYRHREGLKTLWRQHYSYGLADPVLYRRFRGEGVPPPRVASVVAAYLRLLAKLPLLISDQKRPGVVRSLAKRWGRVRSSIRERVMYL